MSVWLGGLAALIAGALDRDRWSFWATRAVGLIAATGVVQAIVQTGPPVALISTGYGRLLLVKVGLFAGLLGLAALARRRLTRPDRLRPLVLGEIGGLALVLALTVALGLSTPGRAASRPDPLAHQPYAAELTSPLYRLRIEIDPARVGPNSVHLFAVGPTGAPLPVLEWHATVTLTGRGIGPVEVPLRKVTADHEIADITLPAAGTWDFRFTLRLSEVDEATVTARVPVAG